jgi:predicted SAM-dependent methyltransferase
VDLAIAVHVIEHFYEWEVQDVITEWKRILKPGGILIVELPSMTKVLNYIKQCLEQKQPYWMQMTWWAIWGDPRYQDVAMTHKWGYTDKSMQFEMTKAGFEQVTVMEPRYHVKKRDMRVIGIKPKEQST